MTTILARPRASSTRSSTTTNGWTATSRKSAPWRLITATGVPSAASAAASPVPGPRRLAGRITRAFWARTGTRSRCLQTWFPSVITSAPDARSFSASFAVSPVPSAAFSPLTMQKPAPSSSLRPVSRASIARRPGGPNTSPMKRILSAALLRLGRREPAGCAHFYVDVLALVLRDSGERRPLDPREVDDASDLRAAGRDGRAHRQRRVGLEVLERHDHARAAGRLVADRRDPSLVDRHLNPQRVLQCDDLGSRRPGGQEPVRGCRPACNARGDAARAEGREEQEDERHAGGDEQKCRPPRTTHPRARLLSFRCTIGEPLGFGPSHPRHGNGGALAFQMRSDLGRERKGAVSLEGPVPRRWP